MGRQAGAHQSGEDICEIEVTPETIAAYLLPYLKAWGDGSDAGDAFDECVNAREASDFLARGIASLLSQRARQGR
jgi:hypothetical protein